MAVAAKLKRYRVNLLQTANNVDIEKVVTLPPLQRLLVKRVDCMFAGGSNWTLNTVMTTEVGLYTRKSPAKVYSDENLVYKFRRSSYNEGTNRFIEVSPFDLWSWVPPTGYYLYGQYLAVRLATLNLASPANYIVDIYGTLSEVTDFQIAQETVGL